MIIIVCKSAQYKLLNYYYYYYNRFGDAGLREVAIQSDLVAGGSIDSVLNGKIYNRAVRLHKIVYEALMKLLVNKLEGSLSSEADKIILENHLTAMENFKLEMGHEF